jgi:hypothetical protein
MNYDEITTMDNQSWIFVHAYIVQNWKKVAILLNLESVLNGVIFNNCTIVITCFIVIFGGVHYEKLCSQKIHCLATTCSVQLICNDVIFIPWKY